MPARHVCLTDVHLVPSIDVSHDSKCSLVAMLEIHVDHLVAKEKNVVVTNNQFLKLSIDFRSMLLFIRVDANLIHAIL